MGKLARLSEYRRRENPESINVYPSINYRDPEACDVLAFSEGSRESGLYPYEAVQYCRGERYPKGWHVIEDLLTGEFGMFWTSDRPGGGLCVQDYMGSKVCRCYKEGEAVVVGYVFQFIPDLKDDLRVEFVRGPARAVEKSASVVAGAAVSVISAAVTCAAPLVLPLLTINVG